MFGFQRFPVGNLGSLRTVVLTLAGCTTLIFWSWMVAVRTSFFHCTVPTLHGKRVNITFRWIKNNLPQCPVGAGVVCCLPTCARGSHVSASARIEWSSWGLIVFLLVLVGWGLLVLAALMMAGLWQRRGVVFWLSFWCSVRVIHFLRGFAVAGWWWEEGEGEGVGGGGWGEGC